MKVNKKKTAEYWKELDKLECVFYTKTRLLERQMRKDTGIKDIIFHWCDNEIVGIGNENRTMKLIHRHEKD